MSDLTDAEATALCEANRPALQAVADAACIVIGLLEADEAACETVRAACDVALSPDGGPFVIDCADRSLVNITGCSGTVGELEACGPETVTYSKSLSCSQAGSVPEAPACAQDLQAKCPNVLTP